MICISFFPDSLPLLPIRLFPGLPCIMWNPPFAVIYCQLFAEHSTQWGSNPLKQNIQFVIYCSLWFPVWAHIVVFNNFCRTFPFCVWTRILCVCSGIPDILFLSVSQRPYQTVVSLSALPDNHRTEHQWVYSTGPMMVWPLLLKAPRETLYNALPTTTTTKINHPVGLQYSN